MSEEIKPFEMKKRPEGFLSEEYIDHDSEVFDYIRELHMILWRIVGTAGSLREELERYMNTRPDDKQDLDEEKVLNLFPQKWAKYKCRVIAKAICEAHKRGDLTK